MNYFFSTIAYFFILWIFLHGGTNALSLASSQEILANENPWYSQYDQSIARLDDKKFIITWSSQNQYVTGKNNIYGRIFSANGTNLTSEFLLSMITSSDSQQSRALGLKKGKAFVIALRLSTSLIIKLFDANGTNTTSEIRIDSYDSTKDGISLCALEDETSFIVFWTSSGQDGSETGAYARIFSSDGDPITNEFQVNGNTTDEQKSSDIVAIARGKRFVAVWHSRYQDGSGYGVYAKIYLSNGTNITSDIQINFVVNGAQVWPAICALQNSFAVTWTDWAGRDGGGDGVFARIFDNNGTALTNDFQVNEYYLNLQKVPRMASILDDTVFVVTWMSAQQDGSNYGIYAKIFDSSGKNLTRDISINTFTEGDQSLSKIIKLSYENSFAITWQSTGQDNETGTGVYYKTFSLQCPNPSDYIYPTNKFCLSSCNPQLFSTEYIGTVPYCVRCNNQSDNLCSNTSLRIQASSEFIVNNYTTDNQNTQAISYLDNQQFIVAWRSAGQVQAGAGAIAAQIFDSNTSRKSSEFIVSSRTNNQNFPGICSFISRKLIVIVWSSFGQDGSAYGVYGKIFNFSGVSITGEFRLNDYTASNQFTPSISALGDSSFVVVWKSEGQYGTISSIIAKIYSYDGRNLSSEIRVNEEDIAYQSPSVSSLDYGKLFVVAWEGYNASLYKSYAKIFSSNGTNITGQFQLSDWTHHVKTVFVTNFEGSPYFVVTSHMFLKDGSRWGIYAHLYTYDGKRVYSDLQMNNYTYDDQNFCTVTSIGRGQYFVGAWQSWRQDGDGNGIIARVFSINGTAVTPEFVVNQNITGNQTSTQITGLDDEYSFVISWVSSDQDGFLEGVFARKFKLLLCSTSEYFYQNNASCSKTCTGAEFTPRTDSGNLYCDFRCNSNQYYSRDSDSCLNQCSTPFVIKNQSNYLYCDFKCPAGQYYLPVYDTCVTSCEYPYTKLNQSGNLICSSYIIPPVNISDFRTQLELMFAQELPNQNVIFTYSERDTNAVFSILSPKGLPYRASLLGSSIKRNFIITVPMSNNDFYILYATESPQRFYYDYYYANGTLKSSANVIFSVSPTAHYAGRIGDYGFAVLHTENSTKTYLSFFDGTNFTNPIYSDKFGIQNPQIINLKDGKLVTLCSRSGNLIIYPMDPFDRYVNQTINPPSTDDYAKYIAPFTSGGLAYFTKDSSKFYVYILNSTGNVISYIYIADAPSTTTRRNYYIASLDSDLIIACYNIESSIGIKGFFYNSSSYFNITVMLPGIPKCITCSRQGAGFAVGYLLSDVAYALRFNEAMYAQELYQVPCILGQYLYYNGTCGDICNFPLAVQNLESISLCISPCGLEHYINAINSSYNCTNSCTLPFVAQNNSGYLQCVFKCSPSEYYYSANFSCMANCNSPYLPRTEAGNQYCDSICNENQILFWNGAAYACRNYSLNVSIIKPSGIIYNDNEINLTAFIMVDYLYYSCEFSWRCLKLLNTTGTYPCKQAINDYMNSISYQNASIIFPLYYDISNSSKTYVICIEAIWNFGTSSNCTSVQVLPSYLKFSFYALPSLYYTQTLPLQIIVNQTEVTDQNISYSWSISPSLPYTSSNNILTILPNSFAIQRSDLHLVIMASDGLYKTSLPFYVPINQPPYNGTLTVNPQRGYFLTTFYNLTTLGWNDTDLPMKYSFGFIDLEGSSQYLSSFETMQSLQAYLPISSTVSVNVTIFAEAEDFYTARARAYNYTLVQVLSVANFLETSANVITNLLSQANASSTQISTTLRAITDQITSIITASNSGMISSSCPQCSVNGYCINTICICNTGWTGVNCSINATFANQVAQINEYLIAQIGKLIDPMNSNLTSSLLDCLIELTNNPNYNSKNTLNQITDILDNTLNSTKSNVTLTSDQAKKVTTLIDNSFSYLSTKGCNNTNSSAAFFDKSTGYFDKISTSLSQNSNETTTILAKNFELNTVKLSICDLKNFTFNSTSDLAPDLDLQFQITRQNIDCSVQVILQYVAINNNLLSCNASAPVYFSAISLKVLNDSTGKAIDDKDIKPVVTILFTDPAFVKCSSSCNLEGLKCVCESLSIFDIKSQMFGIFASSQLGNLKFNNFTWFSLLESVPFWIVFSMAVMISFVMLLVVKKEAYDLAVPSLRKRKKLSTCKKVSISIMMFHDLLVIFVKKSTLPKAIRLLLYYFRTMLILTFNIIFSLKDQEIYDLWKTLSKFDISFNPYVSVLPFLTIIPFYNLMGYFVGKAWMKESAKYANLRKRFLIGFFILMIVGLNLIIVVISSNLEKPAINGWIFILMQFYLQDFFIMPPFSIVILYLEVSLIKAELMQTKQLAFFKKSINFFMDGYCAFLLFNYKKEGDTATRIMMRRPRRIRVK